MFVLNCPNDSQILPEKKIFGKTFLWLFLLLVSSCSPFAGKPLLTIGVVTDIHYYRDREPAGTRYYSLSAEKLSEAVDTFNGQDVDFTVSLGDTFDPDIRSYQDIEAVFARLKNPVYKVLGNHDCIAPYGTQEQNEVMAAMGIDNPYFSIDAGHGIRCIFIDGNDISYQSTAEGSPGRKVAEEVRQSLEDADKPMAARYNGMLSGKQKDWLKNELESADKAGESVLVFGHMPLMPRDIDAAQWDGEQIDSLLQGYSNVRAVFSGHHHAGASCESGQIMHYTFKGMIEGTQNHYGIIRVYKDRIDVTEYPEI